MPATPARRLLAVAAFLLFAATSVAQIATCREATDSSVGGTTQNYYPFGGFAPDVVTTPFSSDVTTAVGGALYVTITTTQTIYLQEVGINTSAALGTPLYGDLYRTAQGQGHTGNELDPLAWTPQSACSGVAIGVDQESVLRLHHPIRLPAGTYGFMLIAHDFALRSSTAGTATYSDGIVSVTGGRGTDVPHQAPLWLRRPNIALRYVFDGDNGVNVRLQTMVPAAMLGDAGPITELGFASAATATHWSWAIQIRMAHRPNGYQLTTDFGQNMQGAQNVLVAQNYTWSMVAGQWNDVGLDQPFNYDGTSDLAVEVIIRGSLLTFGGTPAGGLWTSSNSLQRAYDGTWSGATTTVADGVDDSGVRMRFTRACPSVGEYGAACGPLRAAHSGQGSISDTFIFRCNGAVPSSFALASLGFESITPTPVPLDGLGWPNCAAFVLPATFEVALTSAFGGADYGFFVPNDSNLIGATVLAQWLQFDPLLPNGVSVSDYTRLIVGQ